MKYLTQADWERLVRAAERYEGLLALVRRDANLDCLRHKAVSRIDIDKIVDGEVERQAEGSRRASGDMECVICRQTYRRHPQGGPIGWGDEQFLNRLCDGRLVKL